MVLIRVWEGETVQGYLAESAGRPIVVRIAKDAIRFDADNWSHAERFTRLAQSLSERGRKQVSYRHPSVSAPKYRFEMMPEVPTSTRAHSDFSLRPL